MIAARPSGRRVRQGFGLVEMILTGALFAAGMVATVQLVGWVAFDRRATERRERALVEASNLMERIKASRWDDLSTIQISSLKLNSSASNFLHGSTLSMKVDTFGDVPIRKKITVEVRWLDRSGRPEAPVRLVAWTHKTGGPGR